MKRIKTQERTEITGSRHGRDVVSDTIAWLLFSAAVVALILVSCILMTLGWPS